MKKTIVISAIYLHLIDKVRELRILSSPPISQKDLSLEIGHDAELIERIEIFKENCIYSIRQLNLYSIVIPITTSLTNITYWWFLKVLGMKKAGKFPASYALFKKVLFTIGVFPVQ